MKKEGWILICLALVFLTGLIAYNLGYMENEPQNLQIYGDISLIGPHSSEAASKDEVSSAVSEASASSSKDAASAAQPSSEAEPEAPVPPEGGWNINTATEEQLLTVEGMTESIAQEIIKFRQMAGRFTDIRELRDVKGVSFDLALRIAERFYCE